MNNSQNQTQDGPRIAFGPLTVDRIIDGVGDNDVALLRQTVKTIYPGVQPGNSLSSALFTTSDFGAEDREYESKRTALVKVPKGSSVEDVKAKIDALEEPRLYRIMSLNFEDCMTEEQKRAIDNGVSSMTYELYKQRLLAKDPDTTDPDDPTVGDPLIFKHNEIEYNFYRGVYFSDVPVEDVDLRPEQATALTQSSAEIARPESVEESVAQEFDS